MTPGSNSGGPTTSPWRYVVETKGSDSPDASHRGWHGGAILDLSVDAPGISGTWGSEQGDFLSLSYPYIL